MGDLKGKVAVGEDCSWVEKPFLVAGIIFALVAVAASVA
jgi:hypothetical protein